MLSYLSIEVLLFSKMGGGGGGGGGGRSREKRI